MPAFSPLPHPVPLSVKHSPGGCGQLSPWPCRRSGVRRRRRGNSRAGWPWAREGQAPRGGVGKGILQGGDSAGAQPASRSVCASDQIALSGALHGRGLSYAQSRGLRQGRPRKCWGSRRGKLDWGPGIGWSEWGKVREGPSRSMEWGKSVLAHPTWDNSGVTQHD